MLEQVTDENAYFTHFIMLCIVINIFTLSIDSYGNGPELSAALATIDEIIVYLFG